MFDAFRRDERAIEGLPIRLVIALVVGVASLGIMLNMLSGIQALGITELDVQPEPEVTGPNPQEIEVTVVDPDGEGISNATVIARGDTANLNNGTATARTDGSGVAEFSIHPTLSPNQGDGTISFSIQPPAAGDFEDNRGNTDLLVVEGMDESG